MVRILSGRCDSFYDTRTTVSSEGGGSVGGAGRGEGQHVEGEGLPAEGVATPGLDGGNTEAETVQRCTPP